MFGIVFFSYAQDSGISLGRHFDQAIKKNFAILQQTCCSRFHVPLARQEITKSIKERLAL
jgi:hypothetical protein